MRAACKGLSGSNAIRTNLCLSLRTGQTDSTLFLLFTLLIDRSLFESWVSSVGCLSITQPPCCRSRSDRCDAHSYHNDSLYSLVIYTFRRLTTPRVIFLLKSKLSLSLSLPSSFLGFDQNANSWVTMLYWIWRSVWRCRLHLWRIWWWFQLMAAQ